MSNTTSTDMKLWSTQMNEEGFMNFIDKSWILLNRLYIIVMIVTVVLTVVGVLVGATAVKESFDISSLRQQVRRR